MRRWEHILVKENFKIQTRRENRERNPKEDLTIQVRSEFKITICNAVKDDSSSGGTLTDFFQYGSVNSGISLRSPSKEK